MGKIKATTDGKKGGILYGKSHAQGGIKAVVTDAGNKEVELEGGEAVVKKSALKDKTVKTLTGTNAQILNLINTRAGGNPIYAPSEVKMAKGGGVNTDILSPYLENLKINGIVLYDKDLIVLMYNTSSQKRNKNLYSPTILRKYLNDYSEEVVNQLTLDLAMEWYDLFDEKDIPKYLKHDRIIIVNNSQVVFDNQANMAKGGSIEDNCISFIKNSEAIKNNGYFHYFKNISIYADFGTKVPKTKSFYLCAYNSGGQKNLKVTDTLNLDLINKLQEIIDCEKSICRIIVDEFFRKAKRIESNDLSRMTGENIIVVDRYNIVCDNIKNEFSSGGSITPSAINNMTKAEQKAFYKTKEGKELDKQTYTKWKSLVNMSKGELESFYNSKEGKEAGLSASEAKAEGIDSGRESARWIMKMKDIPYTEWTSNMWVWAKKQISFVSRMKGMRGDLYDDKGNKTRKHLALLIWGHNPKKMAEGGVIPQQGTLFTKDKKNKLDYKKVGNDYVFKVYDVESNPVENYTRHQYKKRNNNEATMDYNQFINYLYSEHYIDDKKMAEGGNINNMTKAEWIIDGKESTREDFIEIYKRELSNSYHNLNAKKVEYLGDEEHAIKAIKEYNRITEIYTKNGELKRHYMEAVISKAFNEISFRKFGNAFRKNIDEYFSQERRKESLMNTKMNWSELASYIIGDVGYYLRSENDFRAFAKDLGIDIPKNKTNDADIEMAEGGNVGDSNLLAPNGKPSNLTAEQYKLVRTAAFKKWFGDWENDSANASKVVDENGEPLVVYHGTASDFNIFKIGRTGGIFFTNNKNSAERFSSGDLKRIGANPKTLNCFLNIKKYYDKNTNDKILVDNYYQDYFQNRPFIKKQSQKNILKNKFNKYFMDLVSFGIVNEEPLNFLIEKEYDGIIIDAHNNSNSYIVFNSNQIKLADGTNTTFDGSNADIRFAEGGVTGDVFSIKDPEQFKQLITLYNKFSEKFDVDNYFVDDSSVVFLRKVKFTDAELKGMAQYIADLSKNQNFSIISDKKPEISNGYFKFFLKERVRYEDGGNVGNDFDYNEDMSNEPLMFEEGGNIPSETKTPEQMAKEFLNNLSQDAIEELKSKLKEALSELVVREKNALDVINTEIADLEAKKESLKEDRSSDALRKRSDYYMEIKKRQKALIHQTNRYYSVKNGGSLSTFTDKKGLEHESIPDFTSIGSEDISFDEENILTQTPPQYIPIINEEEFRIKGYLFDAIRYSSDIYLLAVNGYRETISKGWEDTKEHPSDAEQGYVLVTLDQLILINDYYYTKAKATERKKAEETNKRTEESYDRIPRERRENHYAMRYFYEGMPVSVKKKVSKDAWEALTLEQKEAIYKPIKVVQGKRLVSKLEDDRMWASFHNMYERFLNPEAKIKTEKGVKYGHPEVFSYWYAFRDMMKWKLKDIKFQRQFLSDMRKTALETSFGMSNTNELLYDNMGILIKRQNGSNIKPIEIEQIRKGWINVNNVYGGLVSLAKEDAMKISHTGTTLVFASKAAGVYIPTMKTIAVSAKYGDAMFESILAHEVAHWIDNKIGEQKRLRWATDNYEDTAGIIASTFRNKMNKKSDSDYINATKECFARALEQHFSISIFGENATVFPDPLHPDLSMTYFQSENYVNKDVYESTMKPLIDKFFEENKDFFKYGIETNEADANVSKEVAPIITPMEVKTEVVMTEEERLRKEFDDLAKADTMTDAQKATVERIADNLAESLKLKKLKLTNKAMKMISNSPAQLEVRKEIDEISSKIAELEEKADESETEDEEDVLKDLQKYSSPKKYNSEIEVGKRYYDNRYQDYYTIEKMTEVYSGGDVTAILKYDKGATRKESGDFILYHIDSKQHSLSKESPKEVTPIITPSEEKADESMSKENLLASLEGAKVAVEFLEGQKKQDMIDYIGGLEILIEIA